MRLHYLVLATGCLLAASCGEGRTKQPKASDQALVTGEFAGVQQSEYAHIAATLTITQENNAAEPAYHIVDHIVQRFTDGREGPQVKETTKGYTGFYDANSATMRIPDNMLTLVYNHDSNQVRFGQITYKRLVK